MKTKFVNGWFHFLEFFIALTLINNAVNLILFPQGAPTGGALSQFLGTPEAFYVYAVWFAGMGLWLIAAKLFKKKRWHNKSLFLIYLSMFFIFAIDWAIGGFGVGLIDNVVVFVLVGWAYLRWKLKTQYIDVKQFNAVANNLKE